MNAVPARIISGKYVVPACALALVSVINVMLEGHVQIEWDHMATYITVFQHKCGIAMVGCVAWMAMELIGVATGGAQPTGVASRHRGVASKGGCRSGRIMV